MRLNSAQSVRPTPRQSPETYVKTPKKAVKKRTPRDKTKPRASRKPKAAKTRAGGTMTESQFFSFLRSALRQKSRRWPPLYKALEAARRPSKSENKRLKWELMCSMCRDWFPQANVQADHIIECGSLKNFADLPGFCERLFVEKEGFRVLCTECHQQVTNQQRAARAISNNE